MKYIIFFIQSYMAGFIAFNTILFHA
ncbi:Putative uncharacterized protein [Escherichia coli D6-117.29]|nr:Putative uncharacterized protein [Escherichia coli D6-117.29]